MTFYNDNEPFVCDWLENLIKAGEISDGTVSRLGIEQLSGRDLEQYGRVHLFAGIGGWDYALKLAGWPADRPVWTASVPCQPFSIASVAGHAQGMSDSRHLWPATFALIRERHPPVVFGEQVPNAVGKGWLDAVFNDLEEEDYACGALFLSAKAVGADHLRERLYWCAHTGRKGWEGHQPLECVSVPTPASFTEPSNPFTNARLPLGGDYSGLLPCDGLSVVVERSALRGYGNSIVPQVAAAFIQSFLEAESALN